ncbi:hypothetical protein L6164_009276 [Bauhinia variegata]|uniref:Uncharacterized protein n=1 Tax=Bauhinia variegata TaxID=167791 RepID=A0ACB9PIE3_BAUVA|nr:hypothetical protein L6164_009276 [Bauhinia variegata]
MADNGSSIEQTLTRPLSTSVEIPVPKEYSPAPTTAPSYETGKDDVDPDPESDHKSKRRKKCPKALEKIEEFIPSNPNQSFSFTFDTKSVACGPEVTPKFGSFNAVKESVPCPAREIEIPAKILERNKEGAEDETEIREEATETVGILRVIEGVEVE